MKTFTFLLFTLIAISSCGESGETGTLAYDVDININATRIYGVVPSADASPIVHIIDGANTIKPSIGANKEWYADIPNPENAEKTVIYKYWDGATLKASGNITIDETEE